MSATYVARTCARLVATESGGQDEAEAAPLSSFRSERAYVLLGDAGAGKSTEFRKEHEELGDAAVVRSARDFVALDVNPEWRDKTLFIDGLDEIRAGTTDGRPALDEIRNRLDQLDWPSYRISCREADWLGSNDRHSLERATPGGRVAVLRLEPLDATAQQDLLATQLDENDLRAFTSGDPRGDIGAMLVNPLMLKLLARAFANGRGSWPASRRDTFDMACRHLACERNEEHTAAGASPPLEEILDAAGELCAIQLLAGKEGYLISGVEDQSAYIALDNLGLRGYDGPNMRPDSWRHALRTKLFSAVHDAQATAGKSRLTPLHRHVAEYLGGRHLAHLVGSGLPARRVVALMTSPRDGRVVTSLRGLSAWLAAHGPEALDRLIDADPVGIGLYGDISSLNGEQKRRLLRAIATLADEGPLLGHEWRDDRAVSYRDTTPWAFRSIVDTETLFAISELLYTSPGHYASERVSEFLLRALEAAASAGFRPPSDFVRELLLIVRDDIRLPEVRLAALDAYISLVSTEEDELRHLERLLDDIESSRLSDPEGDLTGALLESLYPGAIKPADVWRYLPLLSERSGYGRSEAFWSGCVAARSSPEQAAELLDALYAQAQTVFPVLERKFVGRLPMELLVPVLAEMGDAVELSRLFNWLSVASAAGRHRFVGIAPTSDDEAEALAQRAAFEDFTEPVRLVRSWLQDRPDVQQSLFLFWLRNRREDGPLGFTACWRCEALCDSQLQSDFGRWCLDQAVVLAQTEPALARELVRRAHAALDDSDLNEGLTTDVLRAVVSDCGDLEEFVEALFAPVTPDPRVERMVKEHDERREEREDERRKLAEDWAVGLRSSLSQLQDNTFSSANLHRLALAYMGLYAESDEEMDARDSLKDFIGGEEDLVAAVLQAFRESIERPDLPSVDETVALHNESKHAWLALPALAGLRLLDAEDPERLDQLEDGLKRQALALLFCVPTNTTSLPPWFERWFERHPSLVAEVAIRCATAAIRNGDEHPPGLSELDSIGGDADVKHTVKLRLLRSIPTRGSNAQLRLLDRLLLDAMAYSDSDDLQELIDEKLTVTSMTVAQRSRWLTAAALLFEGECVSALIEHVEAHRSAVRHVAEFFHSDRGPGISGHPGLTASISSGTLAALVQMLGRAYPPLERDGLITVEIDAADRVRDMIHQLAQSPDDVAGEALRRMEHDPELSEWQAVLRRRREEQSANQRDAEYRQPGVREVQQTLSGGIPANAADLAALLLDRLDDVGREMRGDSSNPWTSYWNVDAHGRPVAPRPENVCRDSLLTLLKNHPTLSEVDLGPEGSYAAGKRADIRVSRAGFNVPIELKRESHSDLWHAMRNQLMGQYTTDPATDGFGIYLVLWFGGDEMPTPASGQRPSSPEELREMLEAGLSIDEARKVSIRVVDVTKPAG